MKYSDFEKHISQELTNAVDPVDMENLLGDLNLGSQKKKRKFGPYFIWMLLPCLILASGLSFFVFDTETSHNTPKLAHDISKESDKTKYDEVRAFSMSDPNNYQDEENNKENNTKFRPETLVKDTDQLEVITSNSRANKSVDNTTTHLQDKYTHSRNQGKKPKPALPIANKGFFSDFVSQESLSPIVEGNISKNQDGFLSNGSEQSFYKLPSNNNKLDERLESPVFLTRSIDPVTSINQEVDNGFSRMKINCPSFNQAFWRVALVPEIGVFSAYKTLTNKSTEPSFAYDQRKEHEMSLEGVNMGLYGMVIRDKLPVYFKAGVSYSRITERLNQNYSDTTYTTGVGVTSSTVSENGEIVDDIYGDVVTEVVTNVSTRQHNYIHLFDMPVSVGYNAYLLGFDIGLEAGVKVNFMTRATGNLLVGNNEYINLAFNRYFKPRIDISYFGGLMIGRNFKGLGDFYLSPRFTYYPSDFTNEINNISQKYVTLGINAGFVYKIK